jgi:glycosyltransferase involved in cell wall biosynthesis
LKILHVIDRISQTQHGGSAVACYQLAKAQAKLGHDVTIYSSSYQADKQQAPVGVTLVKYPSWFQYKSLVFPLGMFAADFYPYDLLHLHNYRTIPNLLVMDAGKPVVLQAHGNAHHDLKRHTRYAYELWRRVVFNAARAYISDAPMELDHYRKEGADAEKIHFIPVGIDLADFPVLEPDTRGCKNILYMGRLDYGKGPDILVKAFALLDRSDITLTIAGMDYGMEVKLKNMVYDLGLIDRVIFPGVLQGAEKVRVLTNAAVYVMPSRYDIWGISFMESLACGTSVIMTENCGAATLLPKECGIAVPPAENSLAAAIHDVLSSDFTSKHRAYRREWVSRFTWDKIALQTIKLYEDVLA